MHPPGLVGVRIPVKIAIDGPKGSLQMLERQATVIDRADPRRIEVDVFRHDGVEGCAMGLVGLDDENLLLVKQHTGATEKVPILAKAAFPLTDKDDIDVIF